MRRQISILSLAVMFLFFTTAANAVTFTATTSDATVGISASDTVTIDITVVLDAGDSVNSLAASVYDWDNSVVSFTSGEAVPAAFYQVAGQPPTSNLCMFLPTNPGCFPSAPLTNAKGGALVEGTAGGGTGFTGLPEVEIFAGLSIGAFFGPQAFSDLGLDGNPGTAQFTLVFHAVGPGSTTLIIGFGSDLNSAMGPTIGPGGDTNDSITISVVPEPGAFAASLAGLGTVAGILLLRRRSR
jgi:hypothetical protein